MSDLKHPDVGPYAMVEDYYSQRGSRFNSEGEEERYQAFKARLMAELIAVIPPEKGQSDVGEYETKAQQLRLESK